MKSRDFARRPGVVVGLLVYAALVAGCGDGTAPLVPAAVAVVAGDHQTATAGAAVAVPPSIKVTTADGRPVKGVPVTFAPAAESGTVTGGTQVTDATGVATVTSWTLGIRSGTSTLNVTVQGLAPVPITATTKAGAPVTMKIVVGDAQTAVVASVLPTQPTVRVSDSFDNPVPDVAVSFALNNGGTLQNAQVNTDVNGNASPGNWTLSPKAGLQQVTATVAQPNGGFNLSPATFTATAKPDVASNVVILTHPSTNNASGMPFTVQPVVEVRDRYDNAAVLTAPMTISAVVATGDGTLSGTTSVVTSTGRVAFTNLAYNGTGLVQLRFLAGTLTPATSNGFTVPATPQCVGNAIALNYALGQMARYSATASDVPRCITFSAGANNGQQYLLMFENLSPRGNYAQALFPGVMTDNATFTVNLQATGSAASSVSAPVAANAVVAPVDAVSGWMFGDKPAYEIQPTSEGQQALVKRGPDWVSVEGAQADIAVGDTLSVYLEGISRLNIPSGTQKALVRYVDSNIVIAEDVRFFTSDTLTFLRPNGSHNTPIAPADLQQIATEYATYALPQANLLFNGQYNSATTQNPGRPIAVHTMMYADGIWGYTYSTYNYFAFDYWVNTTDGRTKDVYQNAQREADDLFMHEIAHMRHYGLLERAGRTQARGNQWLVEGFARFSERLPIAARLLATQTPSRTQNLVLPYNTSLIQNGRQVFFYDDVPTYVQMGSSMYGGYGASSFVFDYFADHVAATNGNWVTALQDFLVAAGTQSTLDDVVNRYLGIDFGTLFSRARIALYADDYGAGLPASTQYLQYQLRASRYSSTGTPLVDPVKTWQKILPGTAFTQSASVNTGGATGYLIDGTAATGDAFIRVDPLQVQNGFMTIVRIK